MKGAPGTGRDFRARLWRISRATPSTAIVIDTPRLSKNRAMTVPTLVFQSYAPERITPWLARCLASVRDWAALKGHAYRFLDDALFDPVPAAFAARCGDERLPVTDYARLLHARRFLADYERVIWLDADILVLAPERFAIDPASPHLLCRELWTWKEEDGRRRGRWTVNNAAMAFSRSSRFLDFYIESCEAIVARAPPGRLSLGPALLAPLAALTALPLITSVPTVSPMLMADIVAGDPAGPRAHREAWGAPVHAAHLCRSLLEGEGTLDLIPPGVHDAVAERLLAGEVALG